MPGPVQFSVSYLPDVAPSVMSAQSYYETALALADMADEAGLYGVKMTEHYLHPYGGYCPSPLAFLAAVAGRTRNIRLITGCILPAFHHPVKIAAEAAMVDAISQGRVEIGFARAWLPYEFATFGVSMDESRERFQATVETVLRLWTERNVSVDTPFFRFENVNSLPRPTQKPHPPVWVASIRSVQSCEWIGQQGFGLLVTSSGLLKELIDAYRTAFRKAHGTEGIQPRVGLSIPLFMAETDREASREGERYLQRYQEVLTDASKAWDRVESKDYPGYTAMSIGFQSSTGSAQHKAGMAVFGCPDRVVERIHELQESLGVDHILWQVDYGAMPGELARRNLKMFIERVLPRL